MNWVNQAGFSIIGYAMYILPIVSVYIAVQVFRVENNKLPGVMKFGALLLVAWFSGLFGLFTPDPNTTTGGVIGDSLNGLMMSLVNTPVAVFIYILLIIVTSLFVMQKSFNDIGAFFKRLFSRPETSEDAANVTVMRKAAEADKPMVDFKLNEGVPTLTAEERKKSGTEKYS